MKEHSNKNDFKLKSLKVKNGYDMDKKNNLTHNISKLNYLKFKYKLRKTIKLITKKLLNQKKFLVKVKVLLIKLTLEKYQNLLKSVRRLTLLRIINKYKLKNKSFSSLSRR